MLAQEIQLKLAGVKMVYSDVSSFIESPNKDLFTLSNNHKAKNLSMDMIYTRDQDKVVYWHSCRRQFQMR